MLAHPGWGEALLLRQVFPATPLVIWPELWLRPEHLGQSGDDLSVQQMQYLRIKDWLVDGAMADASLAIVPTRYQASTFPERWQKKIAVVHEGVPRPAGAATSAATGDQRDRDAWARGAGGDLHQPQSWSQCGVSHLSCMPCRSCKNSTQACKW